MIYGHNLNLILLLLYRNLMYQIKDYNIDLKEIYLRLSLKKKKKTFQSSKKQFVSFLIILI